jgi:hypothetical protein
MADDRPKRSGAYYGRPAAHYPGNERPDRKTHLLQPRFAAALGIPASRRRAHILARRKRIE